MRNTRRKLEQVRQPVAEIKEQNTPPPKLPMVIEFKMAKLADLKIPTEIYQRPLSPHIINQIVQEGWDEGLQTVILISAETHNVLDGGHRVEAARKLKIDQLPALMYHGLSVEQEARYFVDLNRKRRPVGLKVRHRASLAYADQSALETQKIIDVLAPKKVPLQTIVAANQRHPGILAQIAPTLAEMSTASFSRDFIAGVVHFAEGHHRGFLTQEVVDRLKEPGMYRQICDAIRQVMREHMYAHNRTALPTEWSVKAEGVLLALNTRPARVPREVLISG